MPPASDGRELWLRPDLRPASYQEIAGPLAQIETAAAMRTLVEELQHARADADARGERAEERERKADRRARIATWCAVGGLLVGAAGTVAAIVAVL